MEQKPTSESLEEKLKELVYGKVQDNRFELIRELFYSELRRQIEEHVREIMPEKKTMHELNYSHQQDSDITGWEEIGYNSCRSQLLSNHERRLKEKYE